MRRRQPVHVEALAAGGAPPVEAGTVIGGDALLGGGLGNGQGHKREAGGRGREKGLRCQ